MLLNNYKIVLSLYNEHSFVGNHYMRSYYLQYLL